MERPPWRDPGLPAAERVKDLLGQMSLEEKVAQLYAVWLGAEDAAGEVAPFQSDMAAAGFDWERLIASGLGQLTRPFGSAPVAPRAGAQRLAQLQEQITAANRLAIPALVHEECLTGMNAWKATIYPTPLAWGATFDSGLTERMAEQIGTAMRSLGVHQGLAPVLDVTRDPRWGRTEETIGEDPYLVATVGTAYVKGLQSAGVHATLKHFAGYSASRAARNHAPVSMGRREFAEMLLPFEMAVREGNARSVMASYAAVDGIPSHTDRELLTGLLRGTWLFDGVVVSDYFGVSFLHSMQGVADGAGDAAGAALAAGLDVELPMVNCFGEPLLAALRAGDIAEDLVEQAARRVLMQKCELGLLDPEWSPQPLALSASREDGAAIDLDPPDARALARDIAEKSVVLLANTGVLPLSPTARVALVGPLADDSAAMLGCYTFPQHVGRHHPEIPAGVDIPTILATLRAELPEADIEHVPGCRVADSDISSIPAAVQAAAAAEVCVVVLGDRAGLFGLGTSGEGCDVGDLALPGAQGALLSAVLETGTPVVAVLMSGRPYALGGSADGLAAAVQAFFPGEEGGAAVAGVLSGRVNPSGRLPVSLPRDPGGQPATYLTPRLGQRSELSSVDPTSLYPFGHGLSYTEFAWENVCVDGVPASDGAPVEFGAQRSDARASAQGGSDASAQGGVIRLSLSVRNTGTRAGADVVQLYLHDPVAQVAQPTVRLIGYVRVAVEPGQARRVEFEVHPDTFAFIGRSGERVLEPGEVELRLSTSSAAVRHRIRGRVVGPEHTLGSGRRLATHTTVS